MKAGGGVCAVEGAWGLGGKGANSCETALGFAASLCVCLGSLSLAVLNRSA